MDIDSARRTAPRGLPSRDPRVVVASGCSIADSVEPPVPLPSRFRRLAGSSLRTAAKAPARAALRVRSTATRAEGIVDDVIADIKKKIADNKEKLERAKIVASPPGVPPPPVVPILEPGKIGFVENAERQNSRWSMVGWWSLLLVELVAGKGLLELMGFTVGKGINFTF